MLDGIVDHDREQAWPDIEFEHGIRDTTNITTKLYTTRINSSLIGYGHYLLPSSI